MIKEYCDKCFRQVGVIGDGGPNVSKYQIENVLAVIGRKRDFIICPSCHLELKHILIKYLERDVT